MNNKLIDPTSLGEETRDYKLRPENLSRFIGQTKLKDNLKIFIEAAKSRRESLDHVLLYGPPGLGKTSLAQIIAKELGVSFRSTSGPIITKSGDLAAILTGLEENDILFIDEIHRLNASIEEILYPAMEDYKLDLIIGEGPAARSVKIDLPRFTLIAATTRLGLLTNPLRDRFGIPLRLNFYTIPELEELIKQAAIKLKLKIDQEGAREIGKRSRGTPRIALRLLRRVSDFLAINQEEIIDKNLASDALDRLDVDKVGLDSNDIRYLRFLGRLNGGPVGIDTIAAGLSEDKDSLEETIEPYLLQINFIQRTARGRVLTDNALNHLGLEI